MYSDRLDVGDALETALNLIRHNLGSGSSGASDVSQVVGVAIDGYKDDEAELAVPFVCLLHA
jgi:hypothetical protein